MNADRAELRNKIHNFNRLVSITTIQGAAVPFPPASDSLPWGRAMLIYAPVVSTPSAREPVRPYTENGAHFIAFTHSGELHLLRDSNAEMLKQRQRDYPLQFTRLAFNLLVYTPVAGGGGGLNHKITPTNSTMLWFDDDTMFEIPPIQSAIRAQIDRRTEDAVVAFTMYQGGISRPNTRGFFPLVLLNPSTLYFTTMHLSIEHYYEYWRVYYEFLFDLPEEQRGIYEFLTLPPPSQIEAKPASGRVVSHTMLVDVDGRRTVQKRVAVSEETIRSIDLLQWGGGGYTVKFFGLMSQPIGRTEGDALRGLLEAPEHSKRFELFQTAVIPRQNSTFPGFQLDDYLKSAGVAVWKRPRTNAIIRK